MEDIKLKVRVDSASFKENAVLLNNHDTEKRAIGRINPDGSLSFPPHLTDEEKHLIQFGRLEPKTNTYRNEKGELVIELLEVSLVAPKEGWLGKETVTGTATEPTKFQEAFQKGMAKSAEKKLTFDEWVLGLSFIGFAIYGFYLFISEVFKNLF